MNPSSAHLSGSIKQSGGSHDPSESSGQAVMSAENLTLALDRNFENPSHISGYELLSLSEQLHQMPLYAVECERRRLSERSFTTRTIAGLETQLAVQLFLRDQSSRKLLRSELRNDLMTSSVPNHREDQQSLAASAPQLPLFRAEFDNSTRVPGATQVRHDGSESPLTHDQYGSVYKKSLVPVSIDRPMGFEFLRFRVEIRCDPARFWY